MTYTDFMYPKAFSVEIERLKAENAALKKRLVELEATVVRLQEQLEAARRAGKRQAAPFSKGKPKAHPKKPGRKVGHLAAHRAVPEEVNREEEAGLPLACPDCGGPVMEERVVEQYQVDIPPVRPVTIRFRVHIGHCAHCGRRLQGRHPEQTSEALGAAAVQLGPRALGLAAEAKHELGVPYGKIQRLFDIGFGLWACRAAFARADQRLSARHVPVYQHLQLVVRASHAVFGDETGWKVGGRSAWLWVFTTEAVTVYVIDPRRAHEVAERILGQDFAGVLHCDCFLAYDALACRQQKCLQHLIRHSLEIEESQSGRAVEFSRQVTALLRAAIHLQHRYRESRLLEHGYRVACGRLEATLDCLLAKNLSDEDNVRLAKLLKKHRAQLFLFLYEEGIAPTNAVAEQEIRPAVAVRKMSACNRSNAGAKTHAVLSSIIRTCRKQGQSFLALTVERLRNPQALLPKWLAGLLPPANPVSIQQLAPSPP